MNEELKEAQAMLESLLPDEGLIVRDFEGNEYDIPGEVRGRVQIRALKYMRALWDRMRELVEEPAFDLDTIMTVADDDKAIDLIAELFEKLHPDVAKSARKACGSEDLFDCFRVTDIVGGLVPLGLQFAEGLVGTIGGLKVPESQ